MALDRDPNSADTPKLVAAAVTPLHARPGNDAAKDGPTPVPKKSMRPRIVMAIVAVAVLLAAGTLGRAWWVDGRFMVKTDDAYIQADIAAISPKMQGYIDRIAVVENQRVAAGDIIATLDDGDYRIALATAESRVDAQQSTLARIDAQIVAAQAIVVQAATQKESADALLSNADLNFTRQRALVDAKSAPQVKLDDARSAFDQASAAVDGTVAEIATAEANVAVLRAQHQEAASELPALSLAVDQARRNLDLAVLKAPFAGVVANLAIERGDLVSPGQHLVSIVPDDALYIEANFKETQLAGISPGALVLVTVDALSGQHFEGRVDSVAPATGALFSILPPSNATGNFTKIVQRVAVRISLPSDVLAQGILRAGLSAVVEVDSRTAGSN